MTVRRRGSCQCTSNCENKKQDPGESDVDCGGDVCGICAKGGGCQSYFDCPKGLSCTYGKCSSLNSADPCNDGKKGIGEWDVDCGPTCGKCDLGQSCSNSDQCAAGMCSKASGKCESWDCSNGFWDKAGETDVDCGGNCKAKGKLCKSGQRCVWADDCQSGATCVTFPGFGGLCVPASRKGIKNYKKDGSETGRDCGGPCMKLKAPAALCIAKQCGYKRFQCPIGQGCKVDGDCLDGNCVQASGKCGPNHCIDGYANKGESDKDCGGTCRNGPYAKGCVADQKCNFDSDCAKTLSCSNWDGKGFVGAMSCQPFWNNGLWDYSLEPALDCGGVGSPNKCAAGQRCKVQADCASGLTCGDTAFKWVKRCLVKGSCSDGKLSGDEADVDCGVFCGKAGKSGCKAGKSCRLDGDCRSQKCVGASVNQYGDGTAGTCATTCENGMLDAAGAGGAASGETAGLGEGDVDCGGAVCAKKKCAVSRRCKSHAQCASGFCSSKRWRCAAPTCDDGMKSGGEADVDCGGSCSFKCGTGRSCAVGSDCFSGLCSAAAGGKAGGGNGGKTGGKTPAKVGSCLPPLCQNGKKDVAKGSAEADVDCGGVCALACIDGKTCSTGKDCKSGQCLKSGKCGLDLCQDAKKSGAESDVDCGGGCKSKCGVGKQCASAKDCGSGFCDGKVCVTSACDDKRWTKGETGVDCGGSCAGVQKCALGVACAVGGDCGSGFCDGSVCVKSACVDKKLSLGETDVDCGGSCRGVKGCGFKQGCKIGADCLSNVCDGAVCVTGSCFDKKKTDGETDVDCGGACKATCSTGQGCGKSGDCGSGLCSAVTNVCVTSHCDDGELSGNETDVDCGGACKTPCLPGADCKKGADCVDGVCAVDSAVCVTSTCFDEALTTGVAGKDDELAVDCGGSCDKGCAVDAPCKVTADCASAACGVSGKCASSTCEDGWVSGDETAKDCGGSCAASCGFAAACLQASDCETGYCAGSAGKKLGLCVCKPGLFRSSKSQSCVDCGCNVAGSVANTCDAQGRCGCKPGWGGDKCDVKTDVCKADALVCDDKNICTKNTCDAKQGCVYPMAPEDGKSCDDGDACTTKTACKAGKCAATAAVTCKDDGDACTVEKCDSKDGKCRTSTLDCDDGNPCTADSCDKAKGCVNAALKDNTRCADRGLCLAGKCGCLAMDYMAVVAGKSVCVAAGCYPKGTASTLAGKVTATRLHVSDGGGKIPTTNAYFGYAVAMAEGQMIIAAPDDWSSYSPSKVVGNVFVFERLADGSWTKSKLAAGVESSAWWTSKQFGSEITPRFGRKVAISANYAAVGRWENASSGNHTSIWMYRRYSVNNWSYISPKQLRPAKSLFAGSVGTMNKVSSNYGSALAMDDDTVVVGADQAKISDRLSGALLVYRLVNSTWGFEQRLLTRGWASKAANGISGFGGNVAVSEGRIAAGSPQEAEQPNSYGKGAVRVFVRGGAGWQQEARIYNPNASGQLFGWKVALLGERLVIDSYPGELYLYDHVKGGAWRQRAKILTPDPKLPKMWVKSLALSNDALVVGCYSGTGLPAAVRVFREVAGSWQVVKTLTNPDGQSTDGFLASLAVDGNTILVGATRDQPAGKLKSGSAWLFEGVSAHDSKGVCACRSAWGGDKCDDGDSCTASSVCKAGACVASGKAKVCADDGDVCTIEFCDGVSGGCTSRPKRCDDGDPCSLDGCDAKTGCKAVKSGFADICGGGAGKCQGGACICGGGTFLSAGACADCGCDSAGAAVSWSPLVATTTVARTPAIGAQRIGTAVELSGDFAAVTDGGLKPYPYSSQPKRVRVLERQPSGAWQEAVVLRPASAGSSNFGSRVSISASGARLAASQLSSGGVVHIYERDKAGVWLHRAALSSTKKDGGNGFAEALQIEGDHLIVGAYKERDSSSRRVGGVQFFARVAGKWQPNGRMQCIGSSGVNGDGSACGKQVAISGAWAAFSAASAKNGLPSAYYNNKPPHGAVTVARRGADGAWSPRQRLIPLRNYYSSYTFFGRALALSGDVLAATLRRGDNISQVVIYRRDGDTWHHSASVPNLAGQGAGSLALHNKRLLIGYPTALGTGAAQLFRIADDVASSVTLEATLTVPGVASGARLGGALAIGSGGILLGAVGQLGVDAAGKATTYSGAAYFVAARGSCDGKGKCVCKPGFAGDKCAIKVDVCKADKLDCDDGNACTKDSCDAKIGCQHSADDSAACTDGDLCTSGEQCKAGACVAPQPKTCTNPDKCTVATCAASTGKCASAALSCDDGNPCTADSCTKATGCQHKALADGAACGGGGVCGAGACKCANSTMLKAGVCAPCSCVAWSQINGSRPSVLLHRARGYPYRKHLYFGRYVGAADGLAVTSTGYSSVPGGGKLRVIERGVTGTWQQKATLNGSPTLGQSDAWEKPLLVSKNRIAIGAYQAGKTKIYVFDRSESGAWQAGTVLPSTGLAKAGLFTMDGDTIIVRDDKLYTLQPYAFVAGKWLAGSPLRCGPLLMSTCMLPRLSGHWLMVGGAPSYLPGSAGGTPIYAYDRNTSGDWSLRQTLTSTSGAHNLTGDTAVDGDVMVARAYFSSLLSTGALSQHGELLLYRRDGLGRWTYRSALRRVPYTYGDNTAYAGGDAVFSGRTGVTAGWVYQVDGDVIRFTGPLSHQPSVAQSQAKYLQKAFSIGPGLAFTGTSNVDFKPSKTVTYVAMGEAVLTPAVPQCGSQETGCQWNKACFSDLKGGVTCK